MLLLGYTAENVEVLATGSENHCLFINSFLGEKKFKYDSIILTSEDCLVPFPTVVKILKCNLLSEKAASQQGR